MKLSPERHREILKAVFNYFVKKDLIEKKLIRDGESTNLTELVTFAKLLNCEQTYLFIAIEAAACKINNTELPAKRFKDLAEEQQVTDVMILAIKHKLKNLRTRLIYFEPSIHNLAEELNENDRELDLMSGELAAFLGPLYLEVVTEIFDRLKLIPNF
ncbi:MAG: hypothetical protein WAW11_02590 [Patescibacteria group bacterium]